jgi:hypothetical protein
MATARRLLPLVLVALLLAPAAPAHADDPVRNPGDPSYRVRLSSGPTGRVWRGTERITFTNLDVAPLSSIYLRLWSNGVEGCRAHAIVVADVRGGTAGALDERCTVLPIELDQPVVAGGTATLSFRLTIDLPRRNDRFGFYRGLSLLGTALPTLAIHDDAGWHLPPFVDLGESFYSIVGDYEVTLDVPRGLDTPTTGVAVAEAGRPGRRITTYRADDARDFAWAAGRLAHVRARSGQTAIVVSYQPDGISRARARVALRHARDSLDTFSGAYGTFPYPEMDVVVTAFATFGGMEYPTIIFTNPDRLTVAHEIAHQWWYGIVGDDEYTEPWLDESFATWSQYLPFGGWTECPDGVDFPSDASRITNDMGYWRTHMDEYWVVYGGGGCLLADLASRFGLDRFVEVLRGYAQGQWLDVARTQDFKDAIEAAAAADGLSDFDPDTYWPAWRVD